MNINWETVNRYSLEVSMASVSFVAFFGLKMLFSMTTIKALIFTAVVGVIFSAVAIFSVAKYSYYKAKDEQALAKNG